MKESSAEERFRFLTGARSELGRLWARVPGPIRIVVSDITDRYDPGTGIGELLAVSYVMGILLQFRQPEDVHVCSARGCLSDPSDAWQQENLVVIGGRRANALAGRYQEDPQLKRRLNLYPWDEDEQASQIPEGERTTYIPGKAEDPYAIKSDQGRVLWREETLETGRRRYVIMCCGWHTFGTYAAAQMAFSPDFAAAMQEASYPPAADLVVQISEVNKIHDPHVRHPVDVKSFKGIQRRPASMDNPVDLHSAMRKLFVGHPYRVLRDRLQAVWILFVATWFAVLFPMFLFAVKHFLGE